MRHTATRELFELLLIDNELFLSQVSFLIAEANKLSLGYADHVVRGKFEKGRRWNKLEVHPSQLKYSVYEGLDW